MADLGRPGLSKTEKADFWERWTRGESLSEIARALAKNPGSIHGVLRGKGGIAPVPRKRSQAALTATEREEISRQIAVGFGVREIARAIGRSPSTVSRELTRNGGAEGYRASHADKAAWDHARRPKKC